MAKKSSGEKRAKKASRRKRKQTSQAGSKSDAKTTLTKRQRREAAGELYERAMDSDGFGSAMKLLDRAVEVDPGHIDSWIVLAEEEPDIDKAKEMLETAIRHGMKELRDDLRNSRGMFWGLWHTRPFMRAKRALADLFCASGELDRAAEIMEELLELNEGDNQGVRWELLEVYLRQDRVDDAQQLAARYPSDTAAFISFTAVLLQFRMHGDSPELRQQLQQQAEYNPHIIPRLLDSHLIAAMQPPTFALGSEEEADLYCQQFLFAWKSAPGAISWLRSAAASQNLITQPVGIEDDFDIKKEIQRQRKLVRKLAQVDETWLADASGSQDSAGDNNGWIVTVLVADSEEAVFLDPGMGDHATPDGMLLGLFMAMLDPEDGEPRRPQRILMFDNALCRKLRKRLERLEIDVEVSTSRPEVLDFLEAGTAAMMGPVEVDLDDLKPLPMLDASWVIDWKLLPIAIPGEDGTPGNPCVILVLDQYSGNILSQQMIMSEPQEEDFALVFHQAAHFHQFPEPAVPEFVLVRSADNRESVVFLQEKTNVSVKVGDCSIADEALNGLSDYLAKGHAGPPSFLDACDGELILVEDLYCAANEFFRTQVWLATPAESVVKVSCQEVLPGDWFAIVLGQMGQELGILFFDSLESIQALNEASDINDPGRGAAHLRGISFCLNEQFAIHPDEIAAVEQFGWPVASPEAWPTAFLIDGPNFAPLGIAHLKFLPIAIKATTDRLQNKISDGTTEFSSERQTVSVTVQKLA